MNLPFSKRESVKKYVKLGKQQSNNYHKQRIYVNMYYNSEEKLNKLANLNSYREKDKKKIDNLVNFQSLWVNQPVTKESKKGKIVELNSYDDGKVEVTVRWDDGTIAHEEPIALTPVVEVIDGLTYEESRDLLRLERKIEGAFWEIGKALQEISDRRLYRASHKTFEDYCKDRFGFGHTRPYQLMTAAKIADEILYTNGVQNKNLPIPTAEKQVRPLSSFPEGDRVSIWEEAVKENSGKVPTEKIVKAVAKKWKERPKLSDQWQEGGVCLINPKENEALSGLSGYWCIIAAVNEFSLEVKTTFGTYQAFPENLKDLELGETDKKAYDRLCERLSKLDYNNLEDTAKVVVKALSKGNRIVSKDSNSLLTHLEEFILDLIEEN